jgi:tRNA A37 threonylcarbamoyladenosine dehydratase
MEQFAKTALLLGKESVKILGSARVIVFGIGGVGSYAVEALARSGVGHLTLVDSDTVSITNINRQIHALHSTIGKPKVDVMAERVMDINKGADVTKLKVFVDESNIDRIMTEEFDYAIDAIDSMKSKTAIICHAKKIGVPLISSMGAANKLDPSKFKVADLFQTSVCPMARIMRKQMRSNGIVSLKVVYSTEPPVKPAEANQNGCPDIGSVSFVPPVAGLIIASEVIKDILSEKIN